MIKKLLRLLLCCSVVHVTAPATFNIRSAGAQTAGAQTAEAKTYNSEQLDALLAPIALYPDALLTQILMASTFPLQVVSAGRWVEEPAHKSLTGDELVKALEAQPWDPSVKSLVPFPAVLALLNSNLDWMQQLGYAFADQQAAVMNSVQRLRAQAQSAGNLKTTEQQVVRNERETIVIEPAQPSVVYVPSYNPTNVYGAWPYPSYPPVYLPPPPGYAFGSALVGGMAFAAGAAVVGSLWGWASPGWGRGDVNVNANCYNNLNANRRQINSSTWQANRPGGRPAGLARAPAGPVGAPARAGGLPANAVGRSNVNVPASAVNRPARSSAAQAGAANRAGAAAPGRRQAKTGLERLAPVGPARPRPRNRGARLVRRPKGRLRRANRRRSRGWIAAGAPPRTVPAAIKVVPPARSVNKAGAAEGGEGRRRRRGARAGGGGGGRGEEAAAVGVEADEDRTMTGLIQRMAVRVCIGVVAALALMVGVYAAGPPQKGYASSEEAAAALAAAARSHDATALHAVLGPGSEALLNSGDRIADVEAQRRFVEAYDAKHVLVPEGADRAILNVGSNDWPLPIPIERRNGQWSFDAHEGAQEIIDRRIGRNEIAAIRVSLAYVDAQQDYFDRKKQQTGIGEYARRIVSAPGKQDGLYWPVAEGEEDSPFEPLVAQAKDEGYPGETVDRKPMPYQGYFFRILSSQGAEAPDGAKNYVRNGRMTEGFALIAWPANYASSGIMTFIVNQDGIVFQKDLGPDTARIAAKITQFNSDPSWARVNVTEQ